MRFGHLLGYAVVFLSLASAFPAGGSGQAIKVKPKPAIPNVGLGTITVTATPALVNFSLVPKTAVVGSPAVNITTSWSGLTLLGTITLYGFFSSSNALTGQLSTTSIPTADVFGQVTTGLPTAYTAFTQTNTFGGAGASLKLFAQPILVAITPGSRTDALNLKIDLTSLPQLPADKYTGTLTLQAQEM